MDTGGTKPLTDGFLASSVNNGGSNEVFPEPRSFIEEMEKHLQCLLDLSSRQLPPKRWDQPETEGTVFRRFLGALLTNVRHLKDEKWVLAGYEVLTRDRQIEKFAEVFHVGRVYEEFFGGGSAMSDVALQEFAILRAKALDTEQTLKRLYEHVQRPQPGRPLQPLINFGNPGRGVAPRVFGACAGQYYREQGDLQFLNHPIRASEDFAVARHSDAYTQLCNNDWQLDANAECAGEGTSADGACPGDERATEAPGLQVEFADIAHQFKTLCFGYQLLHVTGLQLNVYNSFYYIPHEKGGKRWLMIVACFLIQFLSPLLLFSEHVEFLEELSMGGRAAQQGTWISASVFCVVILFNVINQEIFAKQVRNSLVVRKLRNVVWNSSETWQSVVIAMMDLYANVVNPCITAIVINTVLFSSTSVLDAILNALALNFITEVDEYVVRSDLDDAQLQHEQDLPKKIVRFIAGDKRMACTYELSSSAMEDQAARKVITDDIQKTAQIVTPCLTIAFAGSFVAFLALSCM